MKEGERRREKMKDNESVRYRKGERGREIEIKG